LDAQGVYNRRNHNHKEEMDSEDDYEYNMDTRVLTEQGYAVGGCDEKRERANNSSSSSENRDDYDDPPIPSPPHTMDLPSVRRLPVPAMVPADRVSTHDLPLAETLSVAERELFHNCRAYLKCYHFGTNRPIWIFFFSYVKFV